MKTLNKKWVIVMSLAVAGLLAGCSSWFDDDPELEIDQSRSEGYFVSILNDSLAVFRNGRFWEEHTESCDYYDSCDRGLMNAGLFLVNFRNKQAPVWGDSMEGKIRIIEGFAADSTVLVVDEKDYFGFWKIGAKPKIKKKWIWSTECSVHWDKYARPWMDGNVLIKLTGTDVCPFVVLDTATGNVTKLDISGEYAWLEGCEDITYVDGKIMCLKKIKQDLCTFNLIANGALVDSLIREEWAVFDATFFSGNGLIIPVWSLDKNDHAYNSGNGSRIVFFDSSNFLLNEFPEMWLKYNSFLDSLGKLVSYQSEDLIITGGD